MGLSADAYLSGNNFAREIETLLRAQWLYICLENEISERGSTRETRVFNESVIVVNTGDQLKAFANICPHRGSRILTRGFQGCLGRFVCPYHRWVFSLDGKLERFGGKVQGVDLGSGVRPDLIELSVFVFKGLVFVSLDGDAQEMERACIRSLWWLTLISDSTLSVLARTQKTANVNWKLWVENFLECYHCEGNHPQLRRMEAFIDAAARGNFEEHEKSKRNAIETMSEEFRINDSELDEKDIIPNYVTFEKLNSGFLTETLDGQLISKPLFPKGFQGHLLFGCIGPFVHFTVCADHFVIFSFEPDLVDQVSIEINWIGISTNEQFSVQNLTHPWSRTVDEDIALVERVQSNLSSMYYRPARYAPLELNSRRFVGWYLKQSQELFPNVNDDTERH